MTPDFHVTCCNLVTWRGVELALVDVAITRAVTREQPPGEHVIEEMRVASRQVNRG